MQFASLLSLWLKRAIYRKYNFWIENWFSYFNFFIFDIDLPAFLFKCNKLGTWCSCFFLYLPFLQFSVLYINLHELSSTSFVSIGLELGSNPCLLLSIKNQILSFWFCMHAGTVPSWHFLKTEESLHLHCSPCAVVPPKHCLAAEFCVSPLRLPNSTVQDECHPNSWADSSWSCS